MKKILIMTLVFLLVFSVVVPFMSFSIFGEELTQMPSDLTVKEAFEEAKNSTDLEVFLLTNQDINLPDMGIKVKKIRNFEQAETKKAFKSIWITEDFFKTMLENTNEIKKLDTYLDSGYSLYFLGMQDLNILREKFAKEKSRDELKIGDKEQAAFVTKNSKGEYFFGRFISSESYTDKEVLTRIIASTWNRRIDHNYTRSKNDEGFSKNITQKVLASGGDSFSIGTGWRGVYSWTQSSFPVYGEEYDGGPQIEYGTYSEWQAGFYLTAPSFPGQDFYALAIEGCMEPYDSRFSADTLRYISDLNSNSETGLQLRSYAPILSPNGTNFNFENGAGLSKPGLSGTIGSSFQPSASNLSLIDISHSSNENMDITFNYKWPYLNFTAYSTQTSLQDTSFIALDSHNWGYAQMDNLRVAQFATVDPGIGGILTSRNSSYRVTTLYK